MSANNLSSTPEFKSEDTFSGTYPDPERLNTLNQMYQPVKVYIEGVEVPYTSISINQAMKQFPSCELEVPPLPGLMEITRYYQPKIHIFYTDQDRGGDRLLFWGHICASAYSKSRAGTGYASIHFRCNHRSKLINDIILYYGLIPESGTDRKPENTSLAGDYFSSTQAAAAALQGITGPVTDVKDVLSITNKNLSSADITKLPDSVAAFEKRLIGVPGAMVNLWNQLKKSCYAQPNMHMNMLAMYIPLFEQGLSFLKRVSGHYLVENFQQNNKIQYCPDSATKASNILVPSFYSTSSQSAVQAAYAVNVATTGIGAAGDTTTFLQLCDMFYESLLYEIITLASPAEVPLDPTVQLGETGGEVVAVETIIKPTMPFYYAPACNVLYPRMFGAIDITQDDDAVPTRVTAHHHQLPNQQSGLGSFYRGPSTVREAIALGSYFNPGKDKTQKRRYDLVNSTAMDYNIPAKYEQGRGIRPMSINLPWWLVLLVKNYSANGSSDQTFPKQKDPEYIEMLTRMKDWQQRYGIKHTSDGQIVNDPEKYTLDPNAPSSGAAAYQAMLFNAVDYEFTKAIVGSRQGTISCVFNPYIIPGYPMDVLDDSPNCPSFHGLCTSVTHSITTRSISTTVGIAAAVSYSELSMYYIPPLHPRLMSQLGMYNDTGNSTSYSLDHPYGDTSYIGDVRSTLLQNPKAKAKADEFYYSVLGVGSVDPTDLYDFLVGQPRPQMRGPEDYSPQVLAMGMESNPDVNGGELNDWLTVPGNLRLVAREIEGKESIAAKFQYTFVDMTEENYSGNWVTFSNPQVDNSHPLEPGASMFLDYQETVDFLKPVKAS